MTNWERILLKKWLLDEYLKIRIFEYLTDNESFILKYSHPQISERAFK